MDRQPQHATIRSIVKDPSLLKDGARSYADLPGGHSEGYDDTFKQVFRRFYQSIEDPEQRRPSIRSSPTGCANWRFWKRNWPAIAQHAWVEVADHERHVAIPQSTGTRAITRPACSW